ncbi:DUF6247 family protein [Kutzneria sp. CA-103260]|uniref:DUF6247 family protein n=1 Tax=Kutzneria sp. CA-103260 TaxID=2802641 RepID=UPI001BABCD20|nr:DUF6247 family protein [Kutzneria sp. CA-103260]QUQ71101.1 hypothetical protein JJ691_88840 [Kutzneria sp. CA-103260]
MASPTHAPEPDRFADRAVETRSEWAGDEEAAARFGSPAAIRAALLSEHAAEFDAAYAAALTSARRTLSLDELHHVLRVWRRVAWQTDTDADAVKAMIEAQRTRTPREGSVSWDDLKAELGI